jgi:23S rRNA G2445 N2-methylase RlmL
MALDIAPGLGRDFAFEKLKNFDKCRWQGLMQQSAAWQKPGGVSFYLRQRSLRRQRATAEAHPARSATDSNQQTFYTS